MRTTARQEMKNQIMLILETYMPISNEQYIEFRGDSLHAVELKNPTRKIL